jgi:hypothetical protein
MEIENGSQCIETMSKPTSQKIGLETEEASNVGISKPRNKQTSRKPK